MVSPEISSSLQVLGVKQGYFWGTSWSLLTNTQKVSPVSYWCFGTQSMTFGGNSSIYIAICLCAPMYANTCVCGYQRTTLIQELSTLFMRQSLISLRLTDLARQADWWTMSLCPQHWDYKPLCLGFFCGFWGRGFKFMHRKHEISILLPKLESLIFHCA